MAKTKKTTVIQDSGSEESSPLQELVKNKKQTNVQAPKSKTVKKPAQKEESEDDTPVQVKAKNTKAPRKASNVSADEESSVPAKKNGRKGSVEKTQVQVKKPVKKAVESSEESEEQVPVTKKPIATKKDAKKAKIVAKQESSEESEEEAPKVTKKPVVKKPVAKVAESSDEESEQPKKQAPRKASKEVKVAPKKAVKPADSDSEEEESKPQARKASKEVKVAPKKAVKPADSDSEEESKPQTRKASKEIKAKKAVKKPVEESESEQEKPQPKRKGSAESLTKKVNKKKVEEPVEEDEQGEFQVAVRGLSFNAYDGDVRSLFEPCGNITNVKMINKPDGSPKGFAFVKFSSRNSFNKALELNGSDHMGRNIAVEEARGKANGAQGGAQGGNNRNDGAPAVIETPTLFIGGLSFQSTQESIKEFFSTIGEVQSTRIVTDKETQRPKGFGYVEFFDVETAKKAYEQLNGSYLDGRQIRLDAATQRDRPQGGNRGGFGGSQGGARGGFGGNRNQGNSAVNLSQDDRNAKKGGIVGFAGKKIAL